MQLKCNLRFFPHEYAKQVAYRPDLPRKMKHHSSRHNSPLNHLCKKKIVLARFMMFTTLWIFIFCSLSTSLPVDRPDTGTYIKDMHRDGYGILTIHNNWTMDTVAVLTDKKVKPLIVVYLRSKESIEITGIEDGNYGLYFTIGNLWDKEAGMFRSVYGYYRYNQLLEFETDDAGNEIEYSRFELDLYEADSSNFVPDQFQFPDIRS